MIVFVSYARRDNDVLTLQRIEQRIRILGQPYIDDLHHQTYGTDRHEIVEEALRKASAFVAVTSPHYLRTPWTQREFGLALDRGIPMSALLPSGTLVGLRSADEFPRPNGIPQPRRAAAAKLLLPARGVVGRMLIAPGLNPVVIHGLSS